MLDMYAEVRPTNFGIAGEGAIIDTATGDQNFVTVNRGIYKSFAFILSGDSGVTGGGNLYLQHSDNNVTFVDVPVDQLRGISAGAGGVAGRIGNIAELAGRSVIIGTTSHKRYLRLRLGNSSGNAGIIAAMALPHNAYRQPVSQIAW